MRFYTGLVLGLCLTLPASAFADFRYEETTQLTGGSIVNMTKTLGVFSKSARQMTDPTKSTILVKGNRMARINPEGTEIIDLDQETITHIDPSKKQYSVTTFQEMKAAMQEAMQKAAQQQPSQPQPQPQAAPAGQPPEMHFKVSVNNTGQSKQVAGLSAAQSILKMTLEAKDQQTGQTGNMAIANDMWMVPEIPGYNEVRDFNERMARKMGDMFSGAAVAPPSLMSPQVMQAQPGMFSGMADMAKEMSKLKGVPVSQIIRLGSTPDGSPLPAASEAALPPSNAPNLGSAAGQAAGDAASNAANSAANSAAAQAESKAGSHLGGFGGVPSSLGNLGFGGFHKKKKEQPAPPAATPTPAWAVLMETSVETTGLSSASIDPSAFSIPAGYSKVPSEYQKHQ